MAEKELLLPRHGINDSGEHSTEEVKKRVNVKERLATLDVVRGLTVCVMIFVDDAGGYLQGKVDHSPWDDITFADFVMPFFLFMVGTSMSMSFRRYKQGLLKKVLIRTAKLFLIGVATQGANFPNVYWNGFDMQTIRIPGILQRIAWAYLCVSLMAMYLPKVNTERLPPVINHYFGLIIKYSLHWLVSTVFLLIYIIVMKTLHVPSYHFPHPNPNVANYTYVTCDKSGDLSPACNAARQVDLWIMGWDHMYPHPEYRRSSSCQVDATYSDCPLPLGIAAPWCYVPQDPEGILASLPTVLTTFLGFHFGNVLIHYSTHKDRLIQWLTLSATLIIIGVSIHFGGWKMNKQLWSPSYLFFMAGCTGTLLSTFYVLMDWTAWQPAQMLRPWKITNVFMPFAWVGLNTFFVYVMAAADIFDSVVEWFYWKNQSTNNLIALAQNYIFCKNPLPAPGNDGPGDDTAGQDDYFNQCIHFDQTAICQGAVFDHDHARYAFTVFVLCKVAFWVVVAWYLNRIGWYWVL